MTRFLSRFRVYELAADSLPSFSPTLAAKPQSLKSPGHPLKAAISLNVAATVVPAGVVNFSRSEKKKGKARVEERGKRKREREERVVEGVEKWRCNDNTNRGVTIFASLVSEFTQSDASEIEKFRNFMCVTDI